MERKEGRKEEGKEGRREGRKMASSTGGRKSRDKWITELWVISRSSVYFCATTPNFYIFRNDVLRVLGVMSKETRDFFCDAHNTKHVSGELLSND